MQHLRVSISGTHSAGKTTLLKMIAEDEAFKEYKLIPGPTRTIKALGFQINEDGNDMTQLMCLSVDIQNLFTNGEVKFISDRCLLDTFIYSKYLFLHGKITEATMTSIGLIWEQYASLYDIIIMPSHFEVPLADDGERSTNIEFRDSVYRLFLEEVNFKMPSLNCYVVGGTPDQRIKQIKQILDIKENESSKETESK